MSPRQDQKRAPRHPRGVSRSEEPGAEALVLHTRGLAELVLDGRAWLVVKTEPHDVDNQTVLVAAEGRVLGEVSLGQMRALSYLELQRLEGQHMLDEDLRDELAERRPAWKTGPWYAWTIERPVRFRESLTAAGLEERTIEGLAKGLRLHGVPDRVQGLPLRPPVSQGRVSPRATEGREPLQKRDVKPAPAAPPLKKEEPVKAQKSTPAPAVVTPPAGSSRAGATPSAPPSRARKAALVFEPGAPFGLEMLVQNGADSCMGWQIAAARPAAKVIPEQAEQVAKAFTIEGNRWVRPLSIPLDARPLGDRPLSRMKAEAPYLLDEFQVEPGLRQEGPVAVHELFVKGAREASGIFLAEKHGEDWIAQLRKDDLVPAVLRDNVVAAGVMPRLGLSALPSSLEEVVPLHFRFWLAKTEDQARACRDALAEARFFSAENVRVVNGELRRVEQKRQFFITEPPRVEKVAVDAASLARPAGLTKQVAGLLPPAAALRNPFYDDAARLRADWALAVTAQDAPGAVLVLSPPDLEAVPLQHLVEKAAALRGDFFIEVPDSPETRAALMKIGRPFVLGGPAAHGRLFCASFKLASVRDVTWIDHLCGTDAQKVDVRAELEKILSSIGSGRHELAGGAEVGRVEKALRTVYGREMRIKKTGEERYVLGIVLEPEVVDAQKDIYSSDEVRAACYRYMEDFQNSGLMHSQLVNGRVRLLENYLAPVDFSIGEEQVKKGTWLQALRIRDDGIWSAVKGGDLTGLSIGGSAVRSPAPGAGVNA